MNDINGCKSLCFILGVLNNLIKEFVGIILRLVYWVYYVILDLVGGFFFLIILV